MKMLLEMSVVFHFHIFRNSQNWNWEHFHYLVHILSRLEVNLLKSEVTDLPKLSSLSLGTLASFETETITIYSIIL